MGNFVISIKPEDEETLKKYRRDVQYTKLAGSFQGAAAGEAMEGIGEGAAKGGEGSAPAVIAGIGLAGTVFPAAAAAPRNAPCAKCGAQVTSGPELLSNYGAEQPTAALLPT